MAARAPGFGVKTQTCHPMKIVELIITHGIPGVTALVLALAQLLKARAEIQTVQKAEANACSVKAQNERRSEKTSAIRWRRAFWKECDSRC